MKDDPRFKEWLKLKYSCWKCNKKLFDFIVNDNIFLFYYSSVEVSNCISFSGEKICASCCAKEENNPSSSYK